MKKRGVCVCDLTLMIEDRQFDMAGLCGHSICSRVFQPFALPSMFIVRPTLQRSLGQLRPHYSQVPKIIIFPSRRSHYTHHHGHDHNHAHAQLMQTIAESGKRGTRITVIGLAANVGLTVSKGVAGWMMNSASLLADAGHSLSDMLSDFVTLYTYNRSRKPADALYPYGYGKYETVGSLAVSTLLIGGAIGIGWHSFDLMMGVVQSSGVQETASAVVATASDPSTSSPAAQGVASISDHHGHALNPNAAWFALISIVVKEWLYRATIKVGREEKSDVLIANAWHHRSDAFSSVVALAAIGGSYAGIPILDPLGGLAVSALILKTGGDIMASSLKELCDASIDQDILDQVEKTILQLKTNKPDIVDYQSLRGRKTGPFYLLDMTLHVNPKLTVVQAHALEEEVRQSIQHTCPEVKEIMIHVHAEKQHHQTV